MSWLQSVAYPYRPERLRNSHLKIVYFCSILQCHNYCSLAKAINNRRSFHNNYSCMHFLYKVHIVFTKKLCYRMQPLIRSNQGGHIQNQLRQLKKECCLEFQLGKDISQQKYDENHPTPIFRDFSIYCLTITLKGPTIWSRGRHARILF